MRIALAACTQLPEPMKHSGSVSAARTAACGARCSHAAACTTRPTHPHAAAGPLCATGELQLVFTQVDPAAPERPFSFAVQVQLDGSYLGE